MTSTPLCALPCLRRTLVSESYIHDVLMMSTWTSICGNRQYHRPHAERSRNTSVLSAAAQSNPMTLLYQICPPSRQVLAVAFQSIIAVEKLAAPCAALQ